MSKLLNNNFITQKLFIFFLLLFITKQSNSQSNNLVLNPGFEEDSFCTDFSVDGIWSGCAKYWSGASFQSGLGYYNICSNNISTYNSNTSIPHNNYRGYEFPHKGIAYAGMNIYAQVGDGISQRGYIQGTLKDTLQANKKYAIRYYVSISEESIYDSFCIDNIGFYFSDTHIYYPTIYWNLPLIPQYQNTIGNILYQKNGWQKIEGSFIAGGGERYFIIGNFQDNAHTNIYDCLGTGVDTNQFGQVFSYFDDISVIDTSIIDTVQLCINDSLFLQGAWRKTAGIYYDTIAGMPYQKYLQPKTYTSTHTNFFFEGLPTDSFKTGYFWSHIFSQKDTTFSLIMPSINGCDSVLVFRLRDRSIGIANRPAYTNNNNVSLLIYPNPAEQNINFLISKLANENTAGLKVEIYDAVGRTIKYDLINTKTTKDSSEFKINISNFSSGMYFVKVYDKNNRNIANGKFICR